MDKISLYIHIPFCAQKCLYCDFPSFARKDPVSYTHLDVYKRQEGDSASVAEVIAMISSLSKIPVDQSIAVTGSLNQFGQVQPIGGVNEKIEGFFNVCKKIGTYIGKAVLIPESNKDELILNSEIEEAVRKGEFKIYLMKDINEALSTLLLNDTMSLEDIGNKISEEIKKFKDN